MKLLPASARFRLLVRKFRALFGDPLLPTQIDEQAVLTRSTIARVASRLDQIEAALLDTRLHVSAARKEGDARGNAATAAEVSSRAASAELRELVTAVRCELQDFFAAERARQTADHHALLEGLEAVRSELTVRAALLREATVGRLPATPHALPHTYVLTAFDFNHAQRKVPVDPRLLRDPKTHTFYFFDADGVPDGFDAPALAEADIRPDLADAGRNHLAEWTFFLAEYEKPFLTYPFVAVSSRFYEKNRRLAGSLDMYLPQFGEYLARYGYGYLPSYDRQFDFVDLRQYHQNRWLATRPEAYDLIDELYGVRIPDVYGHTADYWCNYIGFRSRADLVSYVEFYLPVIRKFFDDQYHPIAEYTGTVVDRINAFRNEKPFTLLLELISHLYFYKNRIPYCGLHYDGFYEVSEHTRSFRRLLSFH